MDNFISEDDLNTFEGWMKCQGFDDPTRMSIEALEVWLGLYHERLGRKQSSGPLGVMKLKPLTKNEHRYAVAIRDGANLWLALWIRRSANGELFVFRPSAERGWNPHTSYHLDGRVHMKNYSHKTPSLQRRQPLAGKFNGTEHLGAYFGYTPWEIGARCDPAAFSRVIEVPPGVLGPRDGGIIVDLAEPFCEPASLDWANIVQNETFRESVPWLIIRISANAIGFV